MADEYIKREDAKIILQRAWIEDPFRRQEAFDELNSIPSANVHPVMHGKWVDCRDGYTYCSVCGEDAINKLIKCGYGEIQKTPFCPNCGADMREANDGI